MRLMIVILMMVLLPICLVDAKSKSRFTRDADGVITDSETSLQWLEGPDRTMNWIEAQAWISSLGDGWRSPTRAELSGIYISDSVRRGGIGGTWPFITGKFLLRLDPAFHLNTAYWVWAESRTASTAWAIQFYDGHEVWVSLEFGNNWFDRAFAVRSRR